MPRTYLVPGRVRARVSGPCRSSLLRSPLARCCGCCARFLVRRRRRAAFRFYRRIRSLRHRRRHSHQNSQRAEEPASATLSGIWGIRKPHVSTLFWFRAAHHAESQAGPQSAPDWERQSLFPRPRRTGPSPMSSSLPGAPQPSVRLNSVARPVRFTIWFTKRNGSRNGPGIWPNSQSRRPPPYLKT